MMPLFLASAVPDSIPASIHGVLPGGILTLADAAARALLVACIVGAGLHLLARRHVPAQKTAWGLVLAGALLMPVLAPWAGKATWLPQGATWVVPAHSWSQLILSRAAALMPSKATAAPQAAQSSSITSAVESAPAAPAQVENVDATPAPTAPGDRFPAPTISYSQSEGPNAGPAPPAHGTYYLPVSDLAWMIYGAVCLALLLRLAYGVGGAIGLWQSAETVRLDSNLREGLHLRFSRKISSPVTVGSAVVLPSDYDKWDTEKLRIVLAHERSHVSQGDFYLQALAGLYTAIFWFSPLGWWLKRKLSDLSETISDRAGLEEAASHASYAQILLEFAAMPRRTEVGVAMARTGRTSQRIERLLNENAFRQAFTGGRRRLYAALVLVPAVLFATAALIRVEAAVTLQQPIAIQGPAIGQSHPDSIPDAAQAAAPGTAAAAPTPAHQPVTHAVAAQQQEPTPPAPAPATTPAPAVAPAPAHAPAHAPDVAPPPPPAEDAADAEDQDQDVTNTNTNTRCNVRGTTTASTHTYSHSSSGHGYSYSYSDNGDSYALVSGKDQHAHFSGDWHSSEIDKARAMAHGDFLWFSHDGKSYVMDDPQTVASIQAMYKPMEELGSKQQELGRQQAELGRQQRDLGERQRQASIPTPDVSREMADLNAAISKLQDKKDGTITMDQLSDLQRKIGELQRKVGNMQGRIGDRQGELGHQQGELGRQQGELGRRQGELGREQGRIAREADSKVKSIIDQSLKDGKARQVK
jgi:beta-lactamase regulating signal transducer with metallopeptidase domain